MGAEKNYRSGGGPFGFDVVPHAALMQIFNNNAQGAFVQAPTTPSTQATSTGNGTYYYNLTQGVVILNGKIFNVNAAADQLWEAAGNIMANGYSRWYMLVAYVNTSGTLTLLVVKGTVALTAAAVPPTVAEVVAAIPVANAPYLVLGAAIMNRTGDTTVTEVIHNEYRVTLAPKTVVDI